MVSLNILLIIKVYIYDVIMISTVIKHAKTCYFFSLHGNSYFQSNNFKNSSLKLLDNAGDDCFFVNYSHIIKTK